MSKPLATEPIVFPCAIAIDNREKRPFTFADLHADARDGRRPIAVQTMQATLESGDYSLDGCGHLVAVERKSLDDLFGTIGRGRGRFERELARLNALEFAAVVCEGDWSAVIQAPPERSQLSPKTVFRSVIAWQLRYPRVHWWFTPGRAFAERVTFRILQRYYVLQTSGKGNGAAGAPARTRAGSPA